MSDTSQDPLTGDALPPSAWAIPPVPEVTATAITWQPPPPPPPLSVENVITPPAPWTPSALPGAACDAEKHWRPPPAPALPAISPRENPDWLPPIPTFAMPARPSTESEPEVAAPAPAAAMPPAVAPMAAGPTRAQERIESAPAEPPIAIRGPAEPPAAPPQSPFSPPLNQPTDPTPRDRAMTTGASADAVTMIGSATVSRQPSRFAPDDRLTLAPRAERVSRSGAGDAVGGPHRPEVHAPPMQPLYAQSSRSARQLPMVIAGVGLITAVSIGTVSWWGWANPTLEIDNRLGLPVSVSVGEDAEPPVRIGPREVLRWRVQRSSLGSVRWTVVPVADASVDAISELPLRTMTPTVSQRPFATVHLRTSSAFDDGDYFVPIVTNRTAAPLQIVVNPALSTAAGDQTRIAAAVPAGAEGVPVGIFRLFGNTSVRAVTPDGREATFRELGPEVDRLSGTVRLRFDADAFPSR